MSLKSHEAEAPWNRMGDTDDDLRFAAGLLVCSYVDGSIYFATLKMIRYPQCPSSLEFPCEL